jgi:hypothetical protein
MMRSSTICQFAAVCGFWLWAAANPNAALADTFNGFVQITCSPDLRYFSIRRFGQMNVPGGVVDRLRKSQPSATNPEGIYADVALEGSPAECNLGFARIRVVGIIKDNNVNTASSRFVADYVEVSVEASFGGKPIVRSDRFNLSALGFETGVDFIEVYSDGVDVILRKCAYYEHVNEPQRKAGCTLEKFH